MLLIVYGCIHGMARAEFEDANSFSSVLKAVGFLSIGQGGYDVELSVKTSMELIRPGSRSGHASG